MKLTISHMLMSLALGGAPTLCAQTSPSSETSVMGILPDVPFAACVQKLAEQAHAKGIPPAIIHHNLTNLAPDPDILTGASSQPEFIKPIWDYLDATISDTRIGTCLAKLAERAQALDAIEKTYEVDRSVVLAICGIESSYGLLTKLFNVLKQGIVPLTNESSAGRPPESGNTVSGFPAGCRYRQS
jgi:membrane-bound lytic murein transglycosylase B